MPAKLSPDQVRGFLIPMGGGEELEGDAIILRQFLTLAGQRSSLVLISAYAPPEEQTDALQMALLSFGAGSVREIALSKRSDCEKPETLEAIEQADAVVLMAQQPLRLSTLIGGTVLARLLRRRNAEGMAIAGSAGGAAIMAEHMLASGEIGATPRMGGVTIAPGLGLSNRIVIDHGGGASDRIGRLLAALALNPFALGIGIDPNTAAFIGPDNVLSVVGSGGITVIDPSDVGHSNVAEAKPNAPISLTNLRVHILVHGARFDLDFRRPL